MAVVPTYTNRILSMSTTRDEYYQHFGPLLTEALTLCLLDLINEMRAHAGKPTITRQQALNALHAKLDTLAEYDWMKTKP